MPMYTHRFIVEGSAPFPIDMLRYDHCYPADQAAASILADVVGVMWTHDQTAQLTLVSVTDHKAWLPTAARWSSFNWRVVTGSHEINKY